MIHVQPLLFAAALEELLKFLVPLVFLLIWVINQIARAKGKPGPPQGKPPVRPPQPQPGAGAQGEPQPPAVDPLRQQIDEFLRRIGRLPEAEKPGQATLRPQPTARDESIVLLDEDATASRSGPLGEPLRPLERPSPSAAKRPKKPRPPRRPSTPRRETVAEHVAEQIVASTRAIENKAARLGQRIVQDDAQFDRQIQAKFDHALGTLGGRTETPAAAPASKSAAAEIAAMLSAPEGMRQAIVINEILRRPTELW